jgi:hypothetical protein
MGHVLCFQAKADHEIRKDGIWIYLADANADLDGEAVFEGEADS